MSVETLKYMAEKCNNVNGKRNTILVA